MSTHELYCDWLINSIVTWTARAVVVAQLVERSLWMPEVRGSNPVIGKLFYRTFICLLSTVEKTKIKKKEAEIGPFFNTKKTWTANF